MEYHSVHSAPDSRMNRMEGIRFTRNVQNMRYFGKFLAGNPSHAGHNWLLVESLDTSIFSATLCTVQSTLKYKKFSYIFCKVPKN